jgi:hypothetical protein
VCPRDRRYPLTPGTNPAPTITITGTSGSLDHATDVGVDSEGDLFAARGTGASVDKRGIVAYRAADVASSGSPAAAAEYKPPDGKGVEHVDFPDPPDPLAEVDPFADEESFFIGNQPSGGDFDFLNVE